MRREKLDEEKDRLDSDLQLVITLNKDTIQEKGLEARYNLDSDLVFMQKIDIEEENKIREGARLKYSSIEAVKILTEEAREKKLYSDQAFLEMIQKKLKQN